MRKLLKILENMDINDVGLFNSEESHTSIAEDRLLESLTITLAGLKGNNVVWSGYSVVISNLHHS